MLTVGVDIGGTTVRAGVVDAEGTVHDTSRAHTPSRDDALEDAIVGVIGELIGRHPVVAVGLAVAGFVDPERRTVRFAPHLSWREAPVADRIGARIGCTVTVEHDANCAALAERQFGAGAGAGPLLSAPLLFLALGTGIGAGLLVDQRIYRGAFGVAPELGHIRVVPDGRPCPCGKRGCWERYCSGTALATTAVELLARRRAARWRWPGSPPRTPGASPGGGWPGRRGTATRWRSRRWPSWPTGWARGSP